MTDNEILARWQGWTNGYGIKVVSPCGKVCTALPDYPNDEAACGSLLDTLVEKGYTCQRLESFRILPDETMHHVLHYGKQCPQRNPYGVVQRGPDKPTRREAIIAACLEVVRKEPTNETL